MPVANVDVNDFWANGYTIIRNVYSPDDIEAFRRGASASVGTKGDLLANPNLRRVLVDGNFVSIAQQILGSDDIWYAGDSSYTINSGQRGFHKDNTDRDDPNAPDWQNGRYTVLRFGVYLQDHLQHSGGLNLRGKSHDVVPLTEGKNIYVRTGVGDVAVWSLRTTHSGNGIQLRFPRHGTVDPKKIKSTPSWNVLPAATTERMALFAAIGLNDAHHDRYVEYLKTRTYMADTFRNSVYDAEALAEAKEAGLSVRDLRIEIEGDDTVGKKALWEPFPYTSAKYEA